MPIRGGSEWQNLRKSKYIDIVAEVWREASFDLIVYKYLSSISEFLPPNYIWS